MAQGQSTSNTALLTSSPTALKEDPHPSRGYLCTQLLALEGNVITAAACNWEGAQGTFWVIEMFYFLI